MTETANVVICGAGIAGVSAAYHLTVKHGVRDVVLVDERAPLTLTSDKSTEAYRNWWPGPGDTMVRFMNRSIDLLEELARETDNGFNMNRRGYVFLTADPAEAEAMRARAEAISQLGAGPLRVHTGPGSYRPTPAGSHTAMPFTDHPTGADLILDPALIQHHFPFIVDDAVALLHVRRCGWLSAQQLGMTLLEQAKAHGARFLPGRVTGVTTQGNRVTAVQVDDATIATGTFVIAAGPLLRQVGATLGVELPVVNELHGKVAFDDYLEVIPRAAPLMIWNDPVELAWTEAERRDLAQDEAVAWLLDPFPAGVHFRPEGHGASPSILAIWTYDVEEREPVWPPTFDDLYLEVVLRGLARMVPGLSAYFGRVKNPYVDGGYYCKTPENRPLIGPLPVDGAYVIGALSGYGIMASQAAGELLAAHVTGGALPAYAPAFRLSRYDDPAYQALLADWDDSGQL